MGLNYQVATISLMGGKTRYNLLLRIHKDFLFVRCMPGTGRGARQRYVTLTYNLPAVDQ